MSTCNHGVSCERCDTDVSQQLDRADPAKALVAAIRIANLVDEFEQAILSGKEMAVAAEFSKLTDAVAEAVGTVFCPSCMALQRFTAVPCPMHRAH